MRRDAGVPRPGARVGVPVCSVHGGPPKAIRGTWNYCDGFGWHPYWVDWDAPETPRPVLTVVVA